MKKKNRLCAACGNVLNDDEFQCTICGYLNENEELNLLSDEDENLEDENDDAEEVNEDLDVEETEDIDEEMVQCSNCNLLIIKDSLICPRCHSVFVDCSLFEDAKEKGYILEDELNEILDDIDMSDKDYESILDVFEEENIDIVKDAESLDKVTYECNNCGYKVSESDESCPNCGYYFVEENEIDLIKEINKYLKEEYSYYYVSKQKQFVGLKEEQSDKYYILYVVNKNNEVSLFYRTDNSSIDKIEVDISSKEIEDIKDIIDIIVSFYN